MATSISENLRTAILKAGESRYAISKATGIPQSTLSEFLSGRRGLKIHQIDALGRHLKLELRRRRPGV